MKKSGLLKKILTAGIFAGIAIGVFVGCTKKDSGNKTETPVNENGYKELRIVAGGDSDGVILEIGNLAVKNGYLEEELNKVGFTAKIIPISGAGPVMNESLAAGEADAAVYGDFPGFVSKSNGLDTTLVAETNQKVQFGILTNSDKIKEPSDLEGKKVAVIQGSASAYFWEQYVKENKLDASKIEIVNTQDAASLLATNQIDAYVINIYVAKYMEEKGIGKIFDDSGSLSSHMPTHVFAVRTSLLKENPELGTAINKALIRAYQAATENPDSFYESVTRGDYTTEIMKSEYEFDPSLSYLTPEITKETQDFYDTLNEWMYDHSIITEKIDLDSYIDTSYYQKAVKELAE